MSFPKIYLTQTAVIKVAKETAMKAEGFDMITEQYTVINKEPGKYIQVTVDTLPIVANRDLHIHLAMQVTGTNAARADYVNMSARNFDRRRSECGYVKEHEAKMAVK